MMLQGHFISLTLHDYHGLVDQMRSTGSSGSWLFNAWVIIRGYTPPLFFTISGTVFLFVLTGDNQGAFWKRKRVKKGLYRGLQLIFLGYLLQFNIKNIHVYLSGHLNERMFAFHVLNSIGLGIIVLTLLYGIVHQLKKSTILFTFIVFAFIFFLLRPVVEYYSHPYFPSGAPAALQNLFRGPNSVFPIFPWFGYLCAGGALGILIRLNVERIHTLRYRVYQFTSSILVIISLLIIFRLLSYAFPMLDFYTAKYRIYQLAPISLLMLLLLWLESRFEIKRSFLATVGRNTLVIYFLHAIVLYGAIIGIGLKTYIKSSLSINEAILGALLFIAAFIGLTYIQPKLKLIWNKVRNSIGIRSRK